MVILDHKSSKEMVEDITEKNYSNLEIIFDMDRSGAKIAWDYFFPNRKSPFFIDYIQDKDLWTWKLSYSQEINFALQLYLKIDKLTALLENEENSFEKLLQEGTILKEKNDEKIKKISSSAVKQYFLHKKKVYNIMTVNNITNRNLVSDVGNYLCETYPEIDFAY